MGLSTSHRNMALPPESITAFSVRSFTFFPPLLTLSGMPAYFTADLFHFLARLKRHNNRDWFLAHKEEWETSVRQPVLRFITDFAAPLSEIAPHLVADPRPSRGSMFRIYRDTRFSNDKRPYKTHVAMRFSHRGKPPHLSTSYLCSGTSVVST